MVLDYSAVLIQLRAERERIEQAIQAFERLAQTTGLRRRGRPPKVASLRQIGSTDRGHSAVTDDSIISNGPSGFQI